MRDVPTNLDGCKKIMQDRNLSLSMKFVTLEKVKALVRKLKARLAGLEKLKFVMRRQDMKTIVQGIFNRVLWYCLPLFGGEGATKQSWELCKFCRTGQHKLC